MMHPLAGLRAVILDMDDTLYPESAYVRSGFAAVAAWADIHLGIAEAEGRAHLLALFDAGVRGDTFNRWLAHFGRPAAHLPELIRVYREHTPDIAPFPEIPPLLRSWQGLYKIGLVSDGYLAVQRRKFAALALAPYFDAVVFSDTWGREAWKPSPRPFHEVGARLGVPLARSVYIADNPAKDFLGARRLGLRTIRLRQPGGEYTHLEPPTPEHAPDLTVTSLAALASREASA